MQTALIQALIRLIHKIMPRLLAPWMKAATAAQENVFVRIVFYYFPLVVIIFPDFHNSQRNRKLHGTRRGYVTLENRTDDSAEISW